MAPAANRRPKSGSPPPPINWSSDGVGCLLGFCALGLAVKSFSIPTESAFRLIFPAIVAPVEIECVRENLHSHGHGGRQPPYKDGVRTGRRRHPTGLRPPLLRKAQVVVAVRAVPNVSPALLRPGTRTASRRPSLVSCVAVETSRPSHPHRSTEERLPLRLAAAAACQGIAEIG